MYIFKKIAVTLLLIPIALYAQSPIPKLLITKTLPATITESPTNTFNFGQLSTTATPRTFSYTLAGSGFITDNLTVILEENNSTNAFSISPTGPFTPSIDGTLFATITVRFNPSTTSNNFSATITHNNTDLSNPLVFTLIGTSTPPPVNPNIVVTPLLASNFTETATHVFDFGTLRVNALPRFFRYTLAGTNLNSENLLIELQESNSTNTFSINSTGPFTPSIDGTLFATITIQINPTIASDAFNTTITHSGAGLSTPVVLTFTGKSAVILADASTDVDEDNDGLIEIHYIEELNNIRYNMRGTGYRTSLDSPVNSVGCPNGNCRGYELARDLDFADPNSYASGEVIAAFRPQDSEGNVLPTDATMEQLSAAINPGFEPLGSRLLILEGTFEGNGYAINNLYIYKKNTGMEPDGKLGVGFFAANEGLVRNVGLTNVLVKYRNSGLGENVAGDEAYVGGLIGSCVTGSMVDNCFVTGTLNYAGVGTATNIADMNIGGLVGFNERGNIQNSYAIVTISSSQPTNVQVAAAGGLVGRSSTLIDNCYAVSTLNVEHTSAGGLVGTGSGHINNSYAHSTITATQGGAIGGLTGSNSRAYVRNSYAQTAIIATDVDRAGGLIGELLTSLVSENNYASGTITVNSTSSNTVDVGGLIGRYYYFISVNGDLPLVANCYSEVAITVTNEGSIIVGGLIGAAGSNVNQKVLSITNCYATGAVTATGRRVGGLIGFRGAINITACHWNAETTGQSTGVGELSLTQAGLPKQTGITSQTSTSLQALTATTSSSTTNEQWNTEDWEFGATTQYPALRKKTGELFCPQPTPRISCTPELTVTATLPTGITKEPNNTFDFGNRAVNTETTFTYNLMGTGLYAASLTLTIDPPTSTAFSVHPIRSIIPTPSGNLPTNLIQVTFNPQSIGDSFQATITHAGAGLNSPVVVTVKGSGTPPPPKLTVEAAAPLGATIIDNTYDFGRVSKYTPPPTFTYVLTGTNMSDDPIVLTLGGHAAQFSMSASIGNASAEGNTITLTPAEGSLPANTIVTVSFAGSQAGPYQATINHSGGGLAEPIILTLQGTIATPALELTPNAGAAIISNTYDFGAAATEAAAPVTFSYTITGTDLINKDLSITLGGLNADAFDVQVSTGTPSADGNTITVPVESTTLPANTLVTISFDPSTGTPYQATITHQGAGLDPLVLNLTGSGISPSLTVQAEETLINNTYDFGDLLISASAPATFSYTLTGTHLGLQDIILTLNTEAPASVFTITKPTNITLTPINGNLAATKVVLAFAPIAAGNYEATITHRGAGLVAAVILRFTGHGIATEEPYLNVKALPPAEIINNTLMFGSLSINDPPKSLSYSVTGGNLNGDITLMLTEAGTAKAFTITAPTSTTLTPLNGEIARTIITIAFDPSATQDYAATLRHSGGDITPSTLTLSGAGVAPGKTPLLFLYERESTADLRNLDFGTVTINTTPKSRTYLLRAENVSTNLVLELSEPGSNAFSIISPENTTRTPVGTRIEVTPVTITFNPTENIIYSATVTHRLDGIAHTVLTLTGAGGAATGSPSLSFQLNTPRKNITTLDFGNQSINAATTQTYFLTGENLTSDVTLSITGSDNNAFTLITPAEGLISPENGSITETTIHIRFTPSEIRSYSAILSHDGEGIGTPNTLSLLGSGIAEAPLGLWQSANRTNTVQLSPNPVSNALLVQGNGPLQVLVRTVSGALLGDYRLVDLGEVPFDTLAVGLYIVQVYSQEGVYSQRILRGE